MSSDHYWVGIDWGAEFHQVCVLNAAGECLEQRKFLQTTASLTQMIAYLMSHANGSPKSVRVAIERPHGAVVELLLNHDFLVYSINPKQLDRFRDRHTVAGAKDDRRDAFVLANSLRTDQWAFSALQVENPMIVEIRELIRIDEDLRADENGLQNRLREQLLRYFPAMLTLIADRADPFLWSLLEVATTPEEASEIPARKIASLLKKHRLRRLTMEQVRAVCRSPKLQVSDATVNAAAAHIRMLTLGSVSYISNVTIAARRLRNCWANSKMPSNRPGKLKAASTATQRSSNLCQELEGASSPRCWSKLPGRSHVVISTASVPSVALLPSPDAAANRIRNSCVAPVTPVCDMRSITGDALPCNAIRSLRAITPNCDRKDIHMAELCAVLSIVSSALQSPCSKQALFMIHHGVNDAHRLPLSTASPHSIIAIGDELRLVASHIYCRSFPLSPRLPPVPKETPTCQESFQSSPQRDTDSTSS